MYHPAETFNLKQRFILPAFIIILANMSLLDALSVRCPYVHPKISSTRSLGSPCHWSHSTFGEPFLQWLDWHITQMSAAQQFGEIAPMWAHYYGVNFVSYCHTNKPIILGVQFTVTIRVMLSLAYWRGGGAIYYCHHHHHHPHHDDCHQCDAIYGALRNPSLSNSTIFIIIISSS